ncbi:hypothetical protein MTO96_049378 [Rhipicephalus appendiculatus]
MVLEASRSNGVTVDKIITKIGVRAKQAHQAEEAAIALALADNKCTTILSDSRTAVRNYGRNNVCASAVRVVKCSDRQCTDGLRTRLRWFPAHQGCSFGSNSPNRNETANAAARGLTRRVVAPASLVLAEGVATDDEDDEEEAELADCQRTLPVPKRLRTSSNSYRRSSGSRQLSLAKRAGTHLTGPRGDSLVENVGFPGVSVETQLDDCI